MSDLSGLRTSLPDDLTLNFISACHVLHYHRVLDAYGHLSIRHPSHPDVFTMARQIAPALVSSAEDLVDYRVSDALPLKPSMIDGYVERYIHSEIYKKYPDIHCVIHSHSSSVIPYGISGVPLQPCFHMAGFLGTSTPVYDISNFYKADDIQDMLVRNIRLGEALADHFSISESENCDMTHAVVIMRGHGMTVAAPTMKECVLRAIYTQENAAIQTTVLMTRAASHPAITNLPEARFLNKKEAAAAASMTHWSAERPWNLWVKEVEQAGLYVNRA